jgi:cytochrome c-type biogenesis protein
MSFIPELPSPYLASFAMGLFYGLTVCTAACLPFIASYIAGIGAGFRKGVEVTLVFNSGRIVAYALIGALVGAVSGLIKLFADASVTSVFSVYSSAFFGAVTVAIGAFILFKNRKASPTCGANENHPIKISTSKGFLGKFDVKAFTLGLTRGLIICPPLIALLVYSASFAAPIDSFLFAVLFGVGTAISPIIIFGGMTGWLLNKAPLFRRWISIGGAVVLIVLGAGTIVNTITVIYH